MTRRNPPLILLAFTACIVFPSPIVYKALRSKSENPLLHDVFEQEPPADTAILEHDDPIHVLLYETDALQDSSAYSLVQQLSKLQGIKVNVLGTNHGFEGFGSKYAAVYPHVKELNPNSLVVICDSRDVIVNNPMNSDAYSALATQEFRSTFDEITRQKPGAVVISAEAQCCVSALSHVAPGEYYNIDGSRNKRACSSGEADCLWKGDEMALPWIRFMKERAIEESASEYDDVYLNAGLMVGRAQDLTRLIENTKIGKDEDDQAVLSDYMYMNPDAIVLDYGQKLFGNNRGGLAGRKKEGCVFQYPEGDNKDRRLVHAKTQTFPLFLHSPGKFFECQESLTELLGIKTSRELRRRLQSLNDSAGNYGNYGNYGNHGNYGNYGCVMGEDGTYDCGGNDVPLGPGRRQRKRRLSSREFSLDLSFLKSKEENENFFWSSKH